MIHVALAWTDEPRAEARGGIVTAMVESASEAAALPSRMRAAVIRDLPTERLDVTDVAIPDIVANTDLVVKIEACGICGTDLHILAGASYRPAVPFVLGHEPVGVVVAAGSKALDWIGRRIVITLFTGCGKCSVCRVGDERLCPNLRSITGVLGAWGGYAEFMRVHAPQALEVPATLTSPEAATLVDCGATAANGVRQALARHPGRVLIVGAGPIGFLSAELLLREGVPTQVVHQSEARRVALARLGHDVVPDFDSVSEVPDVVIDCAGVPEVAASSLAILGPRGAYILGGYARIPDLDLAIVARKELSILGVRSGSRLDLEWVMNAAATRAIRLPEISTWALADINSAITALRERRVRGKAVILPNAE